MCYNISIIFKILFQYIINHGYGVKDKSTNSKWTKENFQVKYFGNVP